MVVIFTEITGFIYENAKFFQYPSPLQCLKKMAGNFPAIDGPGSCDQPKEINDFTKWLDGFRASLLRLAAIPQNYRLPLKESIQK